MSYLIMVMVMVSKSLAKVSFNGNNSRLMCNMSTGIFIIFMQ